MLYRKVIGFKLGSYKHNFCSLRLNILVLEEYEYAYDECLKHSYYTRVSLAFPCCFDIIFIILGVRSLI